MSADPDRPGDTRPEEVTAVALRGESCDELGWLRAENHHLHRALSSRAPIEQAKGILMERYRIDAPLAFGLLERWSMNANIKVRQLAGALASPNGHTVEPPARALDWLRCQLAPPGHPHHQPSRTPGADRRWSPTSSD